MLWIVSLLYDKELAPAVLRMLLLGAVLFAVDLGLALAVAFSGDPVLGDAFGKDVLYR